MYLNCRGNVSFVTKERMNLVIDEHKKESTGFVIIALIKDNNCFIVDEVFSDRKTMANKIALYKLNGYKVITNEDNRADQS